MPEFLKNLIKIIIKIHFGRQTLELKKVKYGIMPQQTFIPFFLKKREAGGIRLHPSGMRMDTPN